MSTITKEQLAARLNGNIYGKEITREEIDQAKASGLVVVFGYSDDNVEVRGAWDDEFGCYDGGSWKVGPGGVLTEWRNVEQGDEGACEAYFKQKATATKTLTAIWCPKEPKCSWAYKIDVPHATFDIMEDGELYCRGIVFAVADLIGGAK